MDNRKAVLIRLDNNQPYYLDDSMYTIGRSDSCSIVIKDPTLSREHARVWWDSGNWYLEDSNSANGVELNGVILEPGRAYILSSGCTILLAATYEFRFGWGPEYDNRTISVPAPEQYADARGGGNTPPNKSNPSNGAGSGIGTDIPQGDVRNIVWDRRELKKRGNEDRKRIGQISILPALIYGLIVGIPYAVSQYLNYMDANYYGNYMQIYYVFLAVYALLLIFVLNPLIVGIRRYFYKGIRNVQPFREITWGFRNNYKGIVSTMFYRDAYLFLWMLIYIIPTWFLQNYAYDNNLQIDASYATMILMIPFTIQVYATSMVPYILGKDPNATGIRTLKLSNMMTKGYKLNMWVLDISFIGWIFVSIFTLGIFGPSRICATNAEVFNLLLD